MWVLVPAKFAFTNVAAHIGVMYVAKFNEAVYVLHCFQKQASATSKRDKHLAEARYRAMIKVRKPDDEN